MADIKNIFTMQNIIIYLIIINITVLGGGIGTISGMYAFRHKTQKLHFTIGLPTITILEIIGVIYFTFFA